MTTQNYIPHRDFTTCIKCNGNSCGYYGDYCARCVNQRERRKSTKCVRCDRLCRKQRDNGFCFQCNVWTNRQDPTKKKCNECQRVSLGDRLDICLRCAGGQAPYKRLIRKLDKEEKLKYTSLEELI